MAERIDRGELRALIREALKEALGGPSPAAESPPPLRGRDREGVAPSSEGLSAAPDERAPRHPSPNPSPQGGGEHAQQRPSPSPTPPRTRLRHSEAAPASPRREGEGQGAHFPSGVLNESKVAEFGRTHTKIIIGADVAVTPLARDRAREIKVEIVRQKP